MFVSAAPGLEFEVYPHIRVTCEGGYGYQFEDFSSDTWDSPFGYGLFNVGARFVF